MDGVRNFFEKSLELIKRLLNNRAFLITVIILFVYLLVMIIDWIRTKKFPLVGFVLLVIVGVIMSGYKFVVPLIYKGDLSFFEEQVTYLLGFTISQFVDFTIGISKVNFVFLSLLTIALLVTFFIHLGKLRKIKKRKEFVFKAYQNVPQEILYVVDEQGIVAFKSDLAEETFQFEGLTEAELKAGFDEIYLNGTPIKTKDLFKSIAEIEEQTINLIFIAGKVANHFNLFKQELLFNDKYHGYVVFRPSTQTPLLGDRHHTKTLAETLAPEQKKSLIDVFDEPVVTYDISNENFLLNKEMQQLLNVDKSTLSIDEFTEFVHPEDQANYLLPAKSNDENVEAIVRVKSGSRYSWFTAKRSKDNVVIRKTSTINQRNKLTTATYADLKVRIDDLQAENAEFGIIGIEFTNIEKAKEKGSNVIINTLMRLYLKQLKDGPYKNEMEFFSLGERSFGILVTNKTSLDIIMRELIEETSVTFNEAVYVINKENVVIDLAIGIIPSESMGTLDADELLSITNELIKEARDPKYPNNYSIYHPTDKVIEYDFEDLDIDLSDEFLDKYKIN